MTVSFDKNPQVVPWAVQSFCLEQLCYLERQNRAGKSQSPGFKEQHCGSFACRRRGSMAQVRSVTCFVQAVKDVVETAALFSFGSNSIPS